MAEEVSSIGRRIGNYRIIEEIGSGTYGRVYRGEHSILTSRVVAIKILHHVHFNSQQERESFIREAKVLESLKHGSYILPIIDVGIDTDDFPYIVTEYASKGSLKELCERYAPEPLPLEKAITILEQVGQALQLAHLRDIVHCDLKPANILFNDKGDVWLADFGIATILDSLSSIQQGKFIGTPRYMAPELFLGEVSKEGDQYALGCIAYELVTGKKPFDVEKARVEAIWYHHAKVEPVAPSQLNPHVTAKLGQVILKAMAKGRKDRYPDIATFCTTLIEAYKSSLPPIHDDEDAYAGEGDVPSEDDEALPPVVPPYDDDEEQELPRPMPMPTPIPLRRSRRQLLLLAVSALLLLSLLLCGGIALAAPGTLGSAFSSLQKLGSNVISAPSTATVNIEPKSAQLVNTYIVSGLPSGTPDSSQRQVAARQVTSTTQPQSKTVAATGQKKTVGTVAIGTISFYNSNTSVVYIAANAVFTDAHGIQIANDSLVAIPAGNPAAGTYGHATAPAHAVNIGASGNLGAGDITNTPCCTSGVGVNTTGAFTGGQDPQNYTVVQQNDLDNAANPLKPQLLQSALTSVNGLRHSNEQFVKNAQCSTKVALTSTVGDKATSVTVNVTATCSGEVYDQVGVATIAANLLKAEEDKDLGRSYSLLGNIATAVTSVTADSNGRVSLLVKANGLWVYQFDATAKANLARLIAGKSQNAATSLLLLQAGVSKVDSMSLSSGSTTLPTDPTQITITIVVSPVTVPGSGSPSPGASPTTAGS